MADIQQITPGQLKEMLDSGEEFTLVDVREQDEWNYCHVEGAELMPLSGMARWVEDLDEETYYVFMCHHGNRSMQAAAIAQSYGAKKVGNLVGGIDMWSGQVDSSVPRY